MRVNLPAIRKFRDDLIDRTNINAGGGQIAGVMITHPEADSKGDQRWVVTTDTGLIYSFGDGSEQVTYDDSKWDHRGAVKWVYPLTKQPRRRTMLDSTRLKLCELLLDVPFGDESLVGAHYVNSVIDEYVVRMIDDSMVAIDLQGRPCAWYTSYRIGHDQLTDENRTQCWELVDKRLRQLRDRLTATRKRTRQ